MFGVVRGRALTDILIETVVSFKSMFKECKNCPILQSMDRNKLEATRHLSRAMTSFFVPIASNKRGEREFLRCRSEISLRSIHREKIRILELFTLLQYFTERCLGENNAT